MRLRWQPVTACTPMLLALALAGCGLAPGRPGTARHAFRATSRPVISSPLAWDFDGDGLKEIAVGSWDGCLYVLDANLRDVPGWPQESPGGFFSSPALADLDGNGAPEIVVGAESGLLLAWRADGSAAPGFPVDLGYRIWSSPAVLEGPLIAVGSLDQMVLLDAHGRSAPGWPQPVQGWADGSAAADGHMFVITTLTPGDSSQGWLYAWGLDGGLLPGFPVTLPLDSDSSPALADLDGDGMTWIVVGDDAGFLHVLDIGGQERPGFPVRTAGSGPGPTPTPQSAGGNVYSIEASPAVADLDQDGRQEIAVGSWDGQMYLWNDAGQLLPGWPVRVQDQIISSAALVDLDGDDRLDIVVGSKDGHLYGWTVESRSLPGFPYDLEAAVFSSPWVGDLEADGRADIVVGANNGIHLLRDVGPLGRQGWPMFRHDAAHSGDQTGAGG